MLCSPLDDIEPDIPVCLNASAWKPLQMGLKCCCQLLTGECDPPRKELCVCALCLGTPSDRGYWINYLICRHKKHLICKKHLRQWMRSNLENPNKLCACSRTKLVVGLKY